MKIKNILKWIGTFFQIILVIFAMTIHFLSDKKMGIMRSLTYRNVAFDKVSLKIKIIYALIFILLVILILTIRYYRDFQKFKWHLLFILFNLIIVICALKLDSETLLSYYVLLISAFVVLFIQLIKFIFT